MHEVLVNRLGGLSLPRKSVVRLTDHPNMTLDVYCGHKTTIQLQLQLFTFSSFKVYYLAHNISGLEAMFPNDVGFGTVYRRILHHKY